MVLYNNSGMNKQTMKALIQKIAQADTDFSLIQADDVIAVGLSGGKDSTLLLTALEVYRKQSRKPFKLMGIHIDLGFGGLPFEPVKNYFNQEDIECHVFPSHIAEILNLNKKKDVIQCSLCSKLKKGAVIKAAKSLGCNKVAFAHHADDAIETLFLNMIYGGKLATFEPSMYMTKTEVTFIRPFVYVKEKDIISNVKNLNLPIKPSACPVDGSTKRQAIKEMLNALYTSFPPAHDNFITMLHNQDQLDLWKKSVDKEILLHYTQDKQKQ